MSYPIRRGILILLVSALPACATPLLFMLASEGGERSNLASIDPGGRLSRWLDAGVGFAGGLAYDPTVDVVYAISNDSDGLSTAGACPRMVSAEDKRS
jgi:hypothetical protein